MYLVGACDDATNLKRSYSWLHSVHNTPSVDMAEIFKMFENVS